MQHFACDVVPRNETHVLHLRQLVVTGLASICFWSRPGRRFRSNAKTRSSSGLSGYSVLSDGGGAIVGRTIGFLLGPSSI